MPKRERSGAVINPARVVAPTKVKWLQRERMNAGAGTLTDDEVDAKIFHRRIENFFDGGLQTMNFVEEENLFSVERSENSGEVAFTFEQRAGACFDRDVQFVGDNLRKSGFAQARRAVEQNVIERFAAATRGFDSDGDVFFHALLPDVFIQVLGAHGGVEAGVILGSGSGNDADGIVGIGWGFLGAKISHLICPCPCISRVKAPASEGVRYKSHPWSSLLRRTEQRKSHTQQLLKTGSARLALGLHHSIFRRPFVVAKIY